MFTTEVRFLPFAVPAHVGRADDVTLAPRRALDQRDRPAVPFGRVARRGALAVRRAVRWIAARRAASQRLRQLRELDLRTLRDLGLTRSELASVVAEVDGNAERTRRRIEHAFLKDASSGLRIRNLEVYLSLGVLIVFGSVLFTAADLIPLA